jgi:hypothetical protein
MRALLASVLLLAATAGAAPAPPTQVTARYTLSHKAMGVIGRVDETYRRTGDAYAIRSVSRSEGALKAVFDEQLVVESSGRVGDGGLRPLAFQQRRLNSAKGETHATFDWERGIMRSTHEGQVSEVPLPRHTQDRISVMYQFMNIPLGDGPVEMHMSNGRKVDLYTYRLVSEERLATPAGEFDTLHFARVTSSARESRADLWLAKDRFNLPVRVVFDDPKGLRLEQTLVGLETR